MARKLFLTLVIFLFLFHLGCAGNRPQQNEGVSDWEKKSLLDKITDKVETDPISVALRKNVGEYWELAKFLDQQYDLLCEEATKSLDIAMRDAVKSTVRGTVKPIQRWKFDKELHTISAAYTAFGGEVIDFYNKAHRDFSSYKPSRMPTLRVYEKGTPEKSASSKFELRVMDHLPYFIDISSSSWKANVEKLRSPRFEIKDLKNPSFFIMNLRDATIQDPLSLYLKETFSPQLKKKIEQYQGGLPSDQLLRELVTELNQLLEKPLYQEQRFAKIELSQQTRILLNLYLKPNKEELICLNRALVEDAYPTVIMRIEKLPTKYRKIGEIYETLIKKEYDNARTYLPVSITLKEEYAVVEKVEGIEFTEFFNKIIDQLHSLKNKEWSSMSNYDIVEKLNILSILITFLRVEEEDSELLCNLFRSEILTLLLLNMELSPVKVLVKNFDFNYKIHSLILVSKGSMELEGDLLEIKDKQLILDFNPNLKIAKESHTLTYEEMKKDIRKVAKFKQDMSFPKKVAIAFSPNIFCQLFQDLSLFKRRIIPELFINMTQHLSKLSPDVKVTEEDKENLKNCYATIEKNNGVFQGDMENRWSIEPCKSLSATDIYNMRQDLYTISEFLGTDVSTLIYIFLWNYTSTRLERLTNIVRMSEESGILEFLEFLRHNLDLLQTVALTSRYLNDDEERDWSKMAVIVALREIPIHPVAKYFWTFQLLLRSPKNITGLFNELFNYNYSFPKVKTIDVKFGGIRHVW